MSTHYAHEAEPPSYRHGFHAGNIGDVWKHAVLCALLHDLASEDAAWTLFDCHAGSGSYDLRPTGEWQEGIGRLWGLEGADLPAPLAFYLECVKRRGERRYPGSPLIMAGLKGARDTLICYESDQRAHAELSRSIAGLERVEAGLCDGPVRALEEIAKRPGERIFVHLDPPWNQKADWQTVPAALIELTSRRKDALLALWYPIKSYTRVVAMQKRLEESGLSYLSAELLTSSIDERKNRLNGSGMLIVNPPVNAARRIGELAPILGERCKIKGNHWNVYIESR